MIDRFHDVLVGNSLATMVAATDLAKAGHDVTIINSSKNWGGHFTTVSSGGVRFDPGMVLHEFTSFNPPSTASDLQSYEPAVRNDVGRFCSVVKNYIDRYQESKPVGTPSMYVGSLFLDDLLIANSLHALKSLRFADALPTELSVLDTRSPMHASHKRGSADFAKFDFEAVSLANHGQSLHREVFDPFCRKLLGVSASAILALYHRAAWLPLYYPETLMSYMTSSPQVLAPTTFSYPVGSCVGDLAGQLKDAIVNSPRVTVVTDPPLRLTQRDNGRFEIAFETRHPIHASRLAWGNSLADLNRALGVGAGGEYTRCSIALAFVRIPWLKVKRSFSTLSVVDLDYAMYRITNQSLCAGGTEELARLVIEYNSDFASSVTEADSNFGDHLKRELVTLGVVADASDIQSIEIKTMKNALMLPSAGNLNIHRAESEAVRNAASNVSLVGASGGFCSSSFNDQIVQGLKLASAWEI